MNSIDERCDVTIAGRLARIHPLDLPRLCSDLCYVLCATTGIAPGHAIFASLAAVRDVNELARVDWEELIAAVAAASDLPEPACWSIVLHIRLFAERAVLHHCLFLAKSASTLRLRRTWEVPPFGLPEELGATSSEFEQALREADAAMQTGRACLWAFQRQVLKGVALTKLQALLKRANACYAQYLQALQQAEQLAEYIAWYLDQMVAEEARPAESLAWFAA